MRRHPLWLRVRPLGGTTFARTRAIIAERQLHTVCEEAACPNRGECWDHGTATMMLLGDRCTRRCHFCAVTTGRPAPPDPMEPERVADAVAALGLRHAVITSVARDDLADGGAAQFAATAHAIKRRVPGCRVEALIPDLRGRWESLRVIVEAPVDILDHNLETIPRLHPRVRPSADYARSLELLAASKRWRPTLWTKTGLMLGLGETTEELVDVLRAARAVACDILTLGQYLQPTEAHLPVERYVPPEEFAALRAQALALGFRHVEAGPLVRSSYHAWAHVPADALVSDGPTAEAKMADDRP